MLKKNRILVLVMSLTLSMGLLSGCGHKDTVEISDEAAGDKLQVVCTIFPEYDWAKQIIGSLGENYELTMLLDNGVDLHSYQPTAEDIAKIASCDMFIYVGGESDGWVEDALRENANPDMKVINLLDTLGESVREEEIVEGMQAEEEHDHEENEEAHEHEDEEPEYDEHVWLSLKNTQVIVSAIAEGLETIDSQHADQYKTNAEKYNKELSELDAAYEKTVADASNKTVVFGDRFPFRYLVDDYGLDYYAAFVGCSAETEASFETIVFLSGKMDELGLKHILTIEKSDQKIANTIVQNTEEKNQEILTMNSMQSTTSEDMNNGASYLGIMQDNLDVLKKALQ